MARQASLGCGWGLQLTQGQRALRRVTLSQGRSGQDQPKDPSEHGRANGSWSLAKILVMPTTERMHPV